MTTGRFPISAWAIRNPIPVAVLFIALLLAGMIAYTGLPVKQYPNVSLPVVAVTVTQSGAAPGEMETQITRPVEDALSGISDVRNITSSITQGVSSTAVEFELGVDLQKKTDDVRSRIDQARAILPREIDEPTVSQVEFDSIPLITYAVAAPAMSDAELSWFVDDTVSRSEEHTSELQSLMRISYAVFCL